MRDFFEHYAGNIEYGAPTGCWLWSRNATPHGYGNFKRNGAPHYAHRSAYEAAHGDSSSRGQVVRHKCDTPACVNPAHLEIGTPLDNVRDAWSRNRMAPAAGERAGRAVLCEADVVEARRLAAAGLPICKIEKRFPVSRGTIANAISGRTWRHLAGAVACCHPSGSKPGQSPAAKLTAQQVAQIKTQLAAGVAAVTIARTFSVNPRTIGGIKSGRVWSHVEAA